jgi:hypothetical protein
MTKLTIIATTVLKVVIIIFLAAAQGWAGDSYSKKYRIGCTSCHTSGSNLNDLGVTFKKNGHTFGGKNVQQDEKIKRDLPKDEKDATLRSSDRGQKNPESINSGVADDSGSDSNVSDAEQSIPETRVYSWKGEDGTPHFSDTPLMEIQDKIKPTSDKTTKKYTRSGFRPLSATTPKQTERSVVKLATPHPGKLILPVDVLPVLSETAHPIIKPQDIPKSYEKCMEQILARYPTPKNPEAAMKEFQDAENICEPLVKAAHQ